MDTFFGSLLYTQGRTRKLLTGAHDQLVHSHPFFLLLFIRADDRGVTWNLCHQFRFALAWSGAPTTYCVDGNLDLADWVDTYEEVCKNAVFELAACESKHFHYLPLK
jgi:hypothetical protein